RTTERLESFSISQTRPRKSHQEPLLGVLERQRMILCGKAFNRLIVKARHKLIKVVRQSKSAHRGNGPRDTPTNVSIGVAKEVPEEIGHESGFRRLRDERLIESALPDLVRK